MSEPRSRHRSPTVLVAACALLLALILAIVGLMVSHDPSMEKAHPPLAEVSPGPAKPALGLTASAPRVSARPTSPPARPVDASTPTAAATPAPLLVPLTEDSVVSHFLFADVQASATLNGKTTTLDGDLGSGSRYPLLAEVATPIRIRIPQTEPGQAVQVDAPNGGKIERRNGRLEFRADGGAVDLDLIFTPTLGNGAYTVSVRHAGDVLAYQFWVGPHHPRGQPGAPYVPPTPETLAAEVAAVSVENPSAE